MKYSAGIWILILTEDAHKIEYIPEQKLKYLNLQDRISDLIGTVLERVKAIKAVLINYSEDQFQKSIPLSLKNKTSFVARSNDCEIFYDEVTQKVRVSRDEQKFPLKVLIVDDSATMRAILKKIIQSDSRFQVTHETGSPNEALNLIRQNEFDLITMDLHMPEMTGADLIKLYFAEKKIPTVVISSLRAEESDLVLQSLENGAVDYLQKPEQSHLSDVGHEIIQRLLTAASAQVSSHHTTIKNTRHDFRSVQGLLCIGASTGGTQAIKNVLQQFGAHIPPTVIVQHIPAVFSKAFADRLNQLFSFEVKEAEDGDLILPDRVLIAPGGKQMRVVRSGSGMKVRVEEAPPVNRHKPSVDYLFRSVVDFCDSVRVVGVILTGMGADGAEGLFQLKQRGAYTVAQDEKTSVVYGMPREAVERKAVKKVTSVFNMAEEIFRGFGPER
ncbi:protein-glutamate methylesterase/protein-glutamine glutaminase [Pseudobdellovibrio exovorus]|uniref:Protein-glutamate methylesterase/protein-glutamine glutaminase n=1 Tax=Pseudobdellovibrio exovorus JSS TaxID=1184267 RepID=M4V7Q2_9BACT|nr:chemotaxis response regulator protein-glutamate methylesterase [Pseudobdellovibrio exovorus]AGH95427.1 cheB, glutamate methylesterase [Pseudobdellovibrio exovorus JSS]